MFTRSRTSVAAVTAVVRDELDLVGEGTLGVLCPRGLLDAAVAAVDGPLADRASVLTVEQAKGLEFDGVLLLEPAAIAADSPRGAHDLYVAITRADPAPARPARPAATARLRGGSPVARPAAARSRRSKSTAPTRRPSAQPVR